MIRFFRHYVPLSFVLLATFEFALFYFASSYAASHFSTGLPLTPSATLVASLKPWLFALLMILVISLFGLYEWEWTRGSVACCCV